MLDTNIVNNNRGFTIVELLIVIVVIGVLAAITIVAFSGIQSRAKNSRIQSALTSIQKKIEIYKAFNGDNYPVTQSGVLVSSAASAMVFVDASCSSVVNGPSVTKRTDWVPGLDIELPQSSGEVGGQNMAGCYMYQSDGTSYILSAWNMVGGSPQTSTMYRRIGFRETANQQYYLCNHPNIGGTNPGPYAAPRDMYKYSYTLTNVSGCNEAPPTGA